MTVDSDKYVQLFLEESQEYLEKMSHFLSQLPQADEPRYLWKELFRYAHSLKGMAGTLGFTVFQQLAHDLEDAFAWMQTLTVDEAHLAIAREGLDLMADLLASVQDPGPELVHRVNAFRDRLRALRSEPSPRANLPPPASTPQSPPSPAPPPRPNAQRLQGTVTLAEESVLPAARLMVVHRRLEEFGTLVEARPSLAELQSGQAGTSLRFVLETDAEADTIVRVLQGLMDVVDVQVETVSGPRPEPPADTGIALLPATIRVPLDFVDRMFELASAMFMQVQRLRGTVAQWVGSRLELGDEILLRDSEAIARHLYLHLLDLRMLPLSVLIDPLRRMVDRMAPRMGKRVKLVSRGEDLRLDKAILEHLMDCFVHLVRNAIDHGIEPPDERRMRGKPDAGHISIHAVQQGEWLQIVVLDDGRGMDLDRIAQKALEKGLVTPDQLQAMTPEELVMIVTTPGFSTSHEVTELSGRGIGMDVVRHRVEALGGTLRIETKTGRGTKVVLRVPSRLAILDTLVVRHADYHLAMPLERIVRIEPYMPQRLHYRENVPMWYIDEVLAPVVDLELLFGEPRARDFRGRFITTVQHETGLFALAVRFIVAEYRSVVQRLEVPLSRIPLYSGITVSPNLEVVPLLDTEYIGRILPQLLRAS